MTMPIGPFVNGSAVVLGGLLGAWMGAKLPERVRTSLNPLFGLTSIGLGVMSIPSVKYYAAVVLAAVLGLVIGELCYLEKGIGKAAGSARGLIDKIFPPKEGISQEEFLDKYVAIVVLFCASGTGVFGSMHEGMTGDPPSSTSKLFWISLPPASSPSHWATPYPPLPCRSWPSNFRCSSSLPLSCRSPRPKCVPTSLPPAG